MITRRDLMKMGLLSTGTFLTMPGGSMYGRVSAYFDAEQRSPYLTPFVDELPTLEFPKPVTRPADITPYALEYIDKNPENDHTAYFELAAAERSVKFHRDLPPTPVWAYVDPNRSESSLPKRLLTVKFPGGVDANGFTDEIRLGRSFGQGTLIRFHNNLTTAKRDFGYPTLSMHFHGGHQPAGADGFPHDIDNGGAGFPNPVTAKPTKHFDYMFPFRDVGFEDGLTGAEREGDERPSFYWYHDHILDFTGPNVYRGLAGVAPAFDNLDTGDETTGLGLPSGKYDIPLLFQDKMFDADGSIIFDPFNGDGFLGDTMVVNGVVQPYHEVERRKYRLRFLNASNARVYQMFLTNESGQSFPREAMTQIATEGGLMAKPIRNIRSFELHGAQRVEVIVDFADPMFDNQKYVYIENRMRQDNGDKPDGVASQGTKLLQFRLIDTVVYTNPPIPATLRPFAPIR